MSKGKINCPGCGCFMEPMGETNIHGHVEYFDYTCLNSECENSPKFRSKFVKQNEKAFDFKQYKKFRKKLLKKCGNHNIALKNIAKAKGVKDGRADLEEQVEESIEISDMQDEISSDEGF